MPFIREFQEFFTTKCLVEFTGLETDLPLLSKWMSPPVEWHLRVIEGLAAKLSRVFFSHRRLLSKHTASFFFSLNDGMLMCLRFTRWVWWQGLGISIDTSKAFMGRMMVSWREATKIQDGVRTRLPAAQVAVPHPLQLRWSFSIQMWSSLGHMLWGGIWWHPLPHRASVKHAPLGHGTNFPSDLKYKLCAQCHGQISRPFHPVPSLKVESPPSSYEDNIKNENSKLRI